jgi:hypothetical protein
MASTIATVSFFVLALITMALQLMMYVDRVKFLKTLKGQKGLFFNLSGSSIDRFGTMMQTVFPLKLEIVTDEKLNKLRESSVKSSRYFLISLFVTLTFPIVLFKLLEW